MGHVEKRGEGRWRARYRDPDGRERSRTFAKKVLAEQWLDSIRGALVQGTYIDPAGGRTLFGDYAKRWQEGQVHRATTAAQLGSHMRNHVLPFFEGRPLGAVRPSEVQQWVKGRAENLAPATVEVVYRYLAAVFKAAVADRLIPSSPCVGIKLPQRARVQVVPLETQDVEALIDAVPDRFRGLVVLAAGTGLRQGEALGLTLPHVDFLRRRLDVKQQLITMPGSAPYLGPPKTRASVRTIPLPQVVVDALAAHLERHPAGDLDLIFTTDDGKPIPRNRFSDRIWRPAIAAAKVKPGAGFHALRHYYASLLIRHGESVKTVQARLGHASASETLDTYSHLWPDSEDLTRQAVDEVLGKIGPAASPRPAVER